MLARIESKRLVIRCWRPEDAAPLKDATDSSLRTRAAPPLHNVSGSRSHEFR